MSSIRSTSRGSFRSEARLPVALVRARLFVSDRVSVEGIAAFVEDNFQAQPVGVVPGSSLDAGAGVDRKAGNYRVGATLLLHHESYDVSLTPAGLRDRTDISFVLSADRSFVRDRYRIRTFGVANASQGSGFARIIASTELRDDLTLEASAAWLLGDGDDIFGRLSDSDFASLRLKYHF